MNQVIILEIVLPEGLCQKCASGVWQCGSAVQALQPASDACLGCTCSASYTYWDMFCDVLVL